MAYDDFLGSRQLYITNCSRKCESGQVLSFIKSFSNEVVSVFLDTKTIHDDRQNAIVTFSRPDTIQYVIDKIFGCEIDGFVVQCHVNTSLNNQMAYCEKCAVAIHFRFKDAMSYNEHSLYLMMKEYGTVLSIRIYNEQLAFCQYNSEISARKAISSKHRNGIFIKPKTKKNSKENQFKMINKADNEMTKMSQQNTTKIKIEKANFPMLQLIRPNLI